MTLFKRQYLLRLAIIEQPPLNPLVFKGGIPLFFSSIMVYIHHLKELLTKLKALKSFAENHLAHPVKTHLD